MTKYRAIAVGALLLLLLAACSGGSSEPASSTNSGSAPETVAGEYYLQSVGKYAVLTEHGAEHLTNDGYTSIDYAPAGPWIAVPDDTWEWVIGGEVSPSTGGMALYAAPDLTSAGLGKATSLNSAADTAYMSTAFPEQIDPVRSAMNPSTLAAELAELENTITYIAENGITR